MGFFEKVGQFFGVGSKPQQAEAPPEGGITEKEVHISGPGADGLDWVSCWQEYRLRELAFNSCVNLIAKAIANCEFKTYEKGSPVKKDYYYLFNVEPNINENSTEFWQKTIYKLYAHNEALLVPLLRGGRLNLVVADSWAKPDYIPTQEKVYKDIQVGDQAYTRTLKESEVLHFTLNSTNAKAVVDGLYESYNNLVQATMKATIRNSGQHLKVHIDQVAEGKDEFEKDFGEMLDAQYKPFLSSESGILPEFNGYNFEQFGGEGKAQDTRDIRALVDDIFTFTARGLGIPPVLVQGDVAGISDVVTHWLTTCIDPLAAQISEECNRKLYGINAWKDGDRMTVDTSTIQHFDMLSNAANIEKLIESAYSSINECREATGLEPLPDEWANIHWMTKNISTVDSVARNAANETTKTGGKNSA